MEPITSLGILIFKMSFVVWLELTPPTTVRDNGSFGYTIRRTLSMQRNYDKCSRREIHNKSVSQR